MDHAILCAAVLAGAGALPSAALAAPHDARPPQPLMCSQLAGNAAGVAGSTGIKSIASTIVPAVSANVSYCQVDVLYGTSPGQNINVRVGLPLNTLDGGSGGVQGAWNGRTQGIGGGGCAGSLAVNAPV